MEPTAQSTSFHLGSGAAISMLTGSPGRSSRSSWRSQSPPVSEMDRTNFPAGMGVAPEASMTSSTAQGTTLPMPRVGEVVRVAVLSASETVWPLSPVGARMTSTPSRVFRVVAPKSSVKRKYPSPDRSLLISAIFREWPEKLARSFRSGFPATAEPSARKPIAER